MRSKYFIIPLLVPLYTYSQASDIVFTEHPHSENTIVQSFTNEFEETNLTEPLERDNDFPTHVIRISGNLTNQQLTCEQVNDQIDQVVVQKITPDKFSYNMYIVCNYEPETNLAIKFTINSYFDPKDDKAIDYLKSYLAEYNGMDFLGTKLKIEPAKGMVLSLNVAAGVKKNPNNPPFIEYRKDRSNYYFKSNYEMKMKLLTDVHDNFFTNDPKKVLPFLNKWMFPHADLIYKAVLRDSNYVELQPERIFLMENGSELFVSELKFYFAHNCAKYENHRCLQQGS